MLKGVRLICPHVKANSLSVSSIDNFCIDSLIAFPFSTPSVNPDFVNYAVKRYTEIVILCIGTKHVGIVFAVLMEQSVTFCCLRFDFFTVEVE